MADAFGEPADFIVIGQRQQFDPVFAGAPNHLGGCEQSRRTPWNGNADRR
jgi:hypothetical protein